jgi:two-component system cell cycle sensor histidine kinase/response regulator CckA
MSAIASPQPLVLPSAASAAEHPAFSPAEERAILGEIYARGDRIIGGFLVAHFVVGLVLAAYYDTYVGAVAGGGLIVALFFLSRHLFPGSRTTRIVAGICLQAFCALAIWQMRGMAEQHFWFFTANTVMILYQDWLALWPGPLLIIAQHVWFAVLIKHGETMDMFFEPSQVGVSKFAWHFGIALVEVVICSYLAYLLRRQTLRDAWQRVQLDRGRAMLEESSRRMRAILDNVPDHAWVKDAEGRFIAVNAALARALRRSPEDIIGRTDHEFFPADLAGQYGDNDRAVMRGRIPQRFEERLVDARGRQFDVETIKTPIFDADGAVVGTTGIARDVTDRKRAEEERRLLEAKMRDAQKLESLGILAGGIAHDFNNLLMGILGNANLARLELAAESPALMTVSDIETAALRAAELTKQMLAYSGKGRFVIQRLDLSAVVREMTSLLGTVVSKKATLRLDLGASLPPIEADASQIRQVVMNLLTNASDALRDEPGLITITTGEVLADREYLAASFAEEELPEGRYVYFEVSDTGCGMEEATKARIFDPFFTTKFTGRGLGLAAVLGIVRGHAGTIRVYSEPGRGTTFKILFPAADAADEVSVDAPPTTAWSGSGLILLVDDEETVRAVGRRMLERLGFRVAVAGNGRVALRVLEARAGEVTAVLLDMMMPEMSGEETFRELRRRYPSLPVVLSSGYNEQDATSRFVGRGLAGFIQKPYRVEELRETLRAVLEKAALPT